VKLGLITKKWNKNFEWPATGDCCLVVPGIEKSLILCAASNDGRKLETASDICKVKLSQFKKSVGLQISGIRLSESTYDLMTDSRKFANCKSKAFKVYKARVKDALTIGAVEDCRIVLNYGQVNNDEKMRYCTKHYEDEMKMEINLLSNDNSLLYNKLSDCLYQDNNFKEMLHTKYMWKLIGIDVKKSSFLTTKEIDEMDNDDDASIGKSEIGLLKKNTPLAPLRKKPDTKAVVTFTQINETEKKEKDGSEKKKKKKKKKVKQIEKLMYKKNKPVSGSDAVRKQLFRIKEMNNIQNNHHWRHGPNEGMNGEYSKIIASQGNKNADRFVGFLGFLRDSSYDGNQNVSEMEVERFFK